MPGGRLPCRSATPRQGKPGLSRAGTTRRRRYHRTRPCRVRCGHGASGPLHLRRNRTESATRSFVPPGGDPVRTHRSGWRSSLGQGCSKLRNADNLDRAPGADVVMHILILAYEFPPVTFGGAGTYLAQLAQGLESADLRLTIVVGGGDRRDSIIEANRQVHFLRPAVDELSLGFEYFGLLSDTTADEVVRRCESEWGIPDLIHCNNWFTYRSGERLRDCWGVPIVATVHSLEHLFTPRWGCDTLAYIAELERDMCSRSDLLIAVSASVEDDVRTVCADAKIAVIHNGAQPLPQPDAAAIAEVAAMLAPAGGDEVGTGKRKIVAFAGRLVPQKGLRYLLRAFQLIGTEREDIVLVVAGDGTDLHPHALRYVAERDPVLATSTRFIGKLSRPQLHALYERSAVAVVPSLYEPFGYAAIEAMAAGVPVVCSRMGGLAEIIEHDRSGALVDVSFDACGFARIDPRVLADAIVELVDDQERAMRYRESGRTRAAEFSGARMAEHTLRAYRSAAQQTAESVQARRQQNAAVVASSDAR
ncbi:hypothetical protein XarjCFBP1022_21700 [Xanthomonas arboricola]|nr:hypothetical protein XarjCFBP1022_21700 [Xanthomonas arboricola]